MTQKHPKIIYDNFSAGIAREFKLSAYTGVISNKIISMLRDVVSWELLESAGHMAFKEEGVLKELFKRFNFSTIGNMGLTEAVVFIYISLSKRYNLRVLDLGRLDDYEIGDNKKLDKTSFLNPVLYTAYARSSGEISDDFLVFDTLFNTTDTKEVINIKKMSDIIKASNITSFAIPKKLQYEVASKTLKVNSPISGDAEENKLIIIQDASGSMDEFKFAALAVKAFILDSAALVGFTIEWYYVGNKVLHKEVFSSEDSISSITAFDEYGGELDLSLVLSREDFKGKNVVVITDGTDDFKFPIKPVTNKIHLAYFIENENLKNKFRKYGKSFKIFS